MSEFDSRPSGQGERQERGGWVRSGGGIWRGRSIASIDAAEVARGVEIGVGAVAILAEAAPALEQGVTPRGHRRDRLIDVGNVVAEVVQPFAVGGEMLVVDARPLNRFDQFVHRVADEGEGELHHVGSAFPAKRHFRQAVRSIGEDVPRPDAMLRPVPLHRGVEIADDDGDLIDRGDASRRSGHRHSFQGRQRSPQYGLPTRRRRVHHGRRRPASGWRPPRPRAAPGTLPA